MQWILWARPRLSVLHGPPPTTSRAIPWISPCCTQAIPAARARHTFLELLDEWFPDVHTISLAELNSESAAEFDVVVADWKPAYDNGEYQDGVEPPRSLDTAYAKPTVTIGRVGTTLAGGKIDWL